MSRQLVRSLHFTLIAGLVAAVGLLTPVEPVSAEPETPESPEAATINVNTTNDELNTDGDCSLREAIQAANQDKVISGCTAGSGVNDIINVPAGTYTLNLANAGGLRVTESAFIRGAGAVSTTVDGNNVNTVFSIDYSELFVCDASDAQVLRYSAKGAYAGVFIGAGSGGLSLPNDIVPGEFTNVEQYVYVSGFTSGVKRYNRDTGAYVDTLSTAGSSGVFAPTSLTFGTGLTTDYNLYATNYQPTGGGNAPGVWRFNPQTGAYLDVFVPTTYVPNSITFGPGDDLYVTDPTNHQVLRYNGSTGASMGAFVSAFSGGLNRPRGLVFRGAYLYVASELSNQILRYDSSDGSFDDVFIDAGVGALDAPTQLTFGPDGNLYVLGSSPTGRSIKRYNGTTGAFVDEFVSPGEGPLGQASCLRWMDGVATGPIVHISDTTIRNGTSGVYVDTDASAVLVRDVITDNDGGFGGGISNNGFVQVFDTTISNNNSFNFGGGILNNGSVEIGGSTISGNFSPNAGGGIFNGTDHNLTIYNTTISSNRTNRAGGGIQNQGNAYINNTTIFSNTADSPDSAGDYGGGGIINVSGNVFIRNTIIAGNSDYPAGATEAPDCEGTITSYRHNLIGNDKNCTFAASFGDQVGTPGSPINPLLGPLANNGGATYTYRLLAGSPAINQGSPTFDDSDFVYACREEDQRGYDRTLGGVCDVGAYEVVTFTMKLPIVIK